MGLSTGPVVVVRHRGREPSYRGCCVVEATRMATEVNPGVILSSDSTWYALSESEGNRFRVVGPIPRLLSDCIFRLKTDIGLVGTEMCVICGGAKGFEESEPGTILILNPMTVVKTCFSQVPAAKRKGLLTAVCRSFNVSVPRQQPSYSDEEYCRLVLHELLENMYSGSPFVVGAP